MQTDKRKALFLVVAVITAIVIWFYVDEANASPASTTVTDIPITYLNADADLTNKGLMLLTGEDSTTDETIDLTFTGQRRLLAQLDRSKVQVTADLSSINRVGEQSVRYSVSYLDRKFSSDLVRVTDSSIYTATVDIRELNSKEVELRCDLLGTVAEDCVAGQIQLSQSRVVVKGQADKIEEVSYAKVVMDIGENAMESVTRDLPLAFFKADGTAIENLQIHTDQKTVRVTVPISLVKELRLRIDFNEAPGARLSDMEWSLRPSVVQVSGSASVLKDLDSLVLDSFDLLAVGTESTTHSYAIILPKGCENLSETSRATLRIAYPGKVTVKLAAESFLWENLPGGKHAEILTAPPEVTIFGNDDVVTPLKSEDVALVADLADYSGANGTYTVPAQVAIRGEPDVGVIGEYTLQVRISEEEEQPEDQTGPEAEPEGGSEPRETE